MAYENIFTLSIRIEENILLGFEKELQKAKLAQKLSKAAQETGSPNQAFRRRSGGTTDTDERDHRSKLACFNRILVELVHKSFFTQIYNA